MKWTSAEQRKKNRFEANKELAGKNEFHKTFAWLPVTTRFGITLWLQPVYKRMERVGDTYKYVYYESAWNGEYK